MPASPSRLVCASLNATRPTQTVSQYTMWALFPMAPSSTRAGIGASFLVSAHADASASCAHAARYRGSPFETQIGIGKVIKGWDEGMSATHASPAAALLTASARRATIVARHQGDLDCDARLRESPAPLSAGPNR